MSKYRIHTVAQLTGLSSALIRAWESRYRLVVPERTPAGYRLYSDDDVAVLLGAQRLMRRGMAPMQVAKLSRGEIRGALPLATQPLGEALTPVPRLEEAGPPVSPTVSPLAERADAEPAGLRSAAPSLPPASYAERIERLIEACAAFDQSLVEQLLAQPLAMLPIETACEKLLMPLLHELGERWHRGTLSIAAEHFGTNLVRRKLKALLDALRHPGTGKRLCCACPPGELHELGLLMFTLRAVSQGWDAIYLGANLPTADLAPVVARVQPAIVCLSFVQRREPHDLRELLLATRRVIGERPVLLVGGLGMSGLAEVARAAGAVLLPESGRLDDLFRSE